MGGLLHTALHFNTLVPMIKAFALFFNSLPFSPENLWCAVGVRTMSRQQGVDSAWTGNSFWTPVPGCCDPAPTNAPVVAEAGLAVLKWTQTI